MYLILGKERMLRFQKASQTWITLIPCISPLELLLFLVQAILHFCPVQTCSCWTTRFPLLCSHVRPAYITAEQAQ